MSKVSFRARALDASRPMPVFNADDLPDLSEYAAINRAVPAMPTGMEKEEELELHLQEAITAQQACNTGSSVGGCAPLANGVIPTPKVSTVADSYDALYPCSFEQPRTLIKVEAALNLAPEIPDYDIDSDDESWLRGQKVLLDVSGDQFETIMDRLEKASERQVCSVNEAKALLQEDDDILVAVYDYWLAKRLRIQQPLIPRIKTEKRDGSAVNPYVAFRRRAEKMQTRKNRKNDEDSYEKILKLSHDLRKAVTLLEMIKRREKTKREMINLNIEVFDKRFQCGDFRGDLYRDVLKEAKPAFQFVPARKEDNNNLRAVKRKYKKHKHRQFAGQEDRGLASAAWLLKNAEDWNRPAIFPGSPTKKRRVESFGASEETDPDSHNRYAFKRRRGCVYHAPAPSRTEPSVADSFCPTYLRSKPDGRGNGSLRNVGWVRRRLGRGGRMLFDRASISTELDYLTSEPSPDTFSSLACSSSSSSQSHTGLDSVSTSQPVYYFRPRSPCPPSESEEGRSVSRERLPTLSLVAQPDNGVRTPYARVKGPKGECHVPITVGVTDCLYGEHLSHLRQQRLNTPHRSRSPVEDNCLTELSTAKTVSATAAVLNQARLASLRETATNRRVVRPNRPVAAPHHTNGEVNDGNTPRALNSRLTNGPRTVSALKERTVIGSVTHQRAKEAPLSTGPSAAVLELNFPTPSPSPNHPAKFGPGMSEFDSVTAIKLVDKNPSKTAQSPVAISPPAAHFMSQNMTELSASNHASTNGELDSRRISAALTRPVR